jgi:REP element-mobilizing transposase RayT
MIYNPNIHNRRSVRLKGYDYSEEGLYFITICVQDRKCLFGKIVYGKMNLNDAGNISDNCWLEIPNHFPNVVLHEHIVMPNHVHGIIELIKTGSQNGSESSAVGVENFQPLQSPNVSLSSMGIQNFEPLRIWQRNYYEHIIRNEQSYQQIADYIINNPNNWQEDDFFNQ